jgi:Transposase DDE domain
VLLQFPLARLPYAYEVAPLSTGEITLAGRLSEHLRRNDLALLDRGFFSYGLLWRIQSRGAYFAIRLKGKIRMRTLQRLGDKDRLVRWKPSDTRGKWKKEGWLPSIDLRLIRYQIRGFRATALLTNMLNAQKIPREDWVRLTTTCEVGRPLQPGLYHRRWEIETTFFELKVTQGMERSLRSRTPDGIEYEMAGHVLLYLLVRWLMVEAAVEHGLDPLRLSFTEARRELQVMQVALLMASPAWATRVLLPRLLQRIAAHTVPYRPGRSFPRPKDGRIKDRGHGQKQRPAKLKRFKG